MTPQPPLADYGFTYVKSQRLFRTNFNIGRHGDVPDHSTIANWLSLFTGSTQGKTGGSLKIVCTPHKCGKSKSFQSTTVQKGQRGSSRLRCKFRTDHCAESCMKIYTFIHTKFRLQKNSRCQTFPIEYHLGRDV